MAESMCRYPSCLVPVCDLGNTSLCLRCGNHLSSDTPIAGNVCEGNEVGVLLPRLSVTQRKLGCDWDIPILAALGSVRKWWYRLVWGFTDPLGELGAAGSGSSRKAGVSLAASMGTREEIGGDFFFYHKGRGQRVYSSEQTCTDMDMSAVTN